MNELKAMQTMGFSWPSPGYLWGALLFGMLGYAAFRRGRKTEQLGLVFSGIALMVFPYLVGQTWILWAVGTALSIWVLYIWS
jgi:apolipoprotein N-acyltransferase